MLLLKAFKYLKKYTTAKLPLFYYYVKGDYMEFIPESFSVFHGRIDVCDCEVKLSTKLNNIAHPLGEFQKFFQKLYNDRNIIILQRSSKFIKLRILINSTA